METKQPSDLVKPGRQANCPLCNPGEDAVLGEQVSQIPGADAALPRLDPADLGTVAFQDTAGVLVGFRGFQVLGRGAALQHLNCRYSSIGTTTAASPPKWMTSCWSGNSVDGDSLQRVGGHLAGQARDGGVEQWSDSRMKRGHLAAYRVAATGLPATVGGRAVLDVLNDDRML
jgi:hypothetical protein